MPHHMGFRAEEARKVSGKSSIPQAKYIEIHRIIRYVNQPLENNSPSIDTTCSFFSPGINMYFRRTGTILTNSASDYTLNFSLLLGSRAKPPPFLYTKLAREPNQKKMAGTLE